AVPTTTTPTTLAGNGAVRRTPHSPPIMAGTAKAAARNRTRIIAGTFLMVVSALVAGLLYSNLGDRHPVVAIARPMAAGQVIQASDLTKALVPTVDGTQTMPWSGRSAIIGKTAAVGLVRGSLLNPSQLASGPSIDPADAVVGVVVKPGEFPAG